MRILSLLLFVLPSFAASEPVDVRTGWHNDFTRVVLSIPEGSTWKVGKTESGYGIQLSDADFQLATVFEKIPRERISEIEAKPDLLDITVICACYADAFLWRPDRLVVDIRDGEAPEESAFEAELNADVSMPKMVIDLLPKPPPPSLEALSPLNNLRMNDAGLDLAGFEQTVLAGLGRAAEQGLIDVAADAELPSSSPAKHAQTVIEVESEVSLPVLETDELAHGPGLLSRTSKDVAVREIMAADNLNATGRQCWPDLFFNVSEWGSDTPFAVAVGEKRSQVFGEFDLVNGDAVNDLARLFVYYGFGREALQSLAMDGSRSQERVALRSLAQIMDNEPVEPDTLSAQASCTGSVGLWAAMAGDADILRQAKDTNAIVRQFRTLPAHLQDHLGPRLALKFVAIGEPDIAELILGTAQSVEAPSVESSALAAKIEADRGEVVDAIEALDEIVSTNTGARPGDLIELVTLQIETDAKVTSSTLALLDAMRFELRSGSDYVPLTVIQIKALTANENIKGALELIVENRDRLDDAQELMNAVTVAAIEQEDALVFLDFALTNNHDAALPEIQNALAARLLDLGFPEEALFILRHQTVQEPMAERRYLRARAAMINGDQASAVAHLTGIDTDRARHILANGADGPDSEGDVESAPDTDAWRRGDWSALATGDDELLEAASNLRMRDTPLSVETDQPLALGRALLSESSNVRETVDGLLTRFDVADAE